MNTKYEKWYDSKKRQEANVLYEKLSRLSTGKKILLKEEFTPEQSEKTAKDICDRLGILTGTTEGQEALKVYKNLVYKTQKNDGRWELRDAVDAVKVYLKYQSYAAKELASEFTPSKLASGATLSTVKGGVKQYGKEELAPLGTFAKQAYGDVKKKFTDLFKENKETLNEAAAGAAAIATIITTVVTAVIGAVAANGGKLLLLWNAYELSDQIKEEVLEPAIQTAGRAVKKGSPGFEATVEKSSEALSGAAGTLRNVGQSTERVTDPMRSRAEEFAQSSERSRVGREISATKEKRGELCSKLFARLTEEGLGKKLTQFDANRIFQPGDIFDCRPGDCIDKDGNLLPPKVFRVVVEGDSSTGMVQVVNCR